MEIVLANDFCYFLKSRKKSQVRPLSMVFNDHGIGVDNAIHVKSSLCSDVEL